MAEPIFSPCGIYCNTCGWFKGERSPKCNGCKEVKGKPFWGKCLKYSCIKTRDIEHCGLCNEFPCTDYISRYDPREGPMNALIRAGLLAYRAKHGDKKALELLEEAERVKRTV